MNCECDFFNKDFVVSSKCMELIYFPHRSRRYWNCLDGSGFSSNILVKSNLNTFWYVHLSIEMIEKKNDAIIVPIMKLKTHIKKACWCLLTNISIAYIQANLYTSTSTHIHMKLHSMTCRDYYNNTQYTEWQQSMYFLFLLWCICYIPQFHVLVANNSKKTFRFYFDRLFLSIKTRIFVTTVKHICLFQFIRIADQRQQNENGLIKCSKSKKNSKSKVRRL